MEWENRPPVGVGQEHPHWRGDSAVDGLEPVFGCEVDSRQVRFEVVRTDDRRGSLGADDRADTERVACTDRGAGEHVVEPDLDGPVSIRAVGEDGERVLTGDHRRAGETGDGDDDAGGAEDESDTDRGESATHFFLLLIFIFRRASCPPRRR